MRRLIPAVVVIPLMLFGCATLDERAPPVDDLFLSEAKVSASEAARLREGRTIYVNFCGDCHSPRKVDNISKGDWKEHLPKMFKKAELYPEEIELVTNYIKTAAPINRTLIQKRP